MCHPFRIKEKKVHRDQMLVIDFHAAIRRMVTREIKQG